MIEKQRGAGPSVEQVPDGDNRPRLVCPDCGYIEYANPKVVVGAVCTWGDRVLLCRRAIAPSRGLWTIPAGFMELGETTQQGAAREVWEEATAKVTLGGLLGIYDIPHINQVHIIFRATMDAADCAPGVESEDARLFAWDEIPWEALAFPSVRWALDCYRAGTAPQLTTAPKAKLR